MTDDISLKKSNLNKTDFPDHDPAFIAKLNENVVLTRKERFIQWSKKPNLGVLVIVFAVIIMLLNTNVLHDFWRWIKLINANEEVEYTLETNPIGVFNESMLTVSALTDAQVKKEMLPVLFNSITRYEDEPKRFLVDFYMTNLIDRSCKLDMNGYLSKVTGGILDSQYDISMNCNGELKKTDFKLVAFQSESIAHHVDFGLIEDAK